jgi:predicted MFS family arabinose efflux permease
MLWGLSWSFLRHVGIMTATDSTTPQRAGRAVGLYNGIARIGSVVGCAWGAYLYDSQGFSPAFLILATVSLLAVPLGLAGRYGVHPHKSHFQRPQPAGGGRGSAALLICAFVTGCVGVGLVLSTLGYVLKAYGGDRIHMDGVVIGVATLTGILLAMRYVVNTFGSPLLGALADHLRYPAGAAGLYIIGAALLLGAAAAPGILAMSVLVVAFYVCATCVQVLLASIAGRRGSRAFARYASAADFGAATGPLLGWAVFEVAPIPALSFIIGGVLYGVAALWAGRAVRADPEPAASGLMEG